MRVIYLASGGDRNRYWCRFLLGHAWTPVGYPSLGRFRCSRCSAIGSTYARRLGSL